MSESPKEFSEQTSNTEDLQGYLGDIEFIDILLKDFFLNTEDILNAWQKEEISEAEARQRIDQDINYLAGIFRGENPSYVSMPAWNGSPLGSWLRVNADLPFPEKSGDLDIITAYFTILTATFMQGWQKHKAGQLDIVQWGDWNNAMRRKMHFQLVGAPG